MLRVEGAGGRYVEGKHKCLDGIGSAIDCVQVQHDWSLLYTYF